MKQQEILQRYSGQNTRQSIKSATKKSQKSQKLQTVRGVYIGPKQNESDMAKYIHLIFLLLFSFQGSNVSSLILEIESNQIRNLLDAVF